MRKAAPLLVLSAAALWGCIGIFVRLLSSFGLSSMEISELRCIFTALILTVALAIFRPRLLRIRLKDIWCFLGTGVLSVLLFNFCYFTTIELTSLSVAAVLLYTAPVFVTLLSRLLFKEKLTHRKILALICALVGCTLVSGVLTGNATLSLVGILVGVCSGIGYALYSIFSRYALMRDYHPLTITAWTFIFGSLGGAFFTDFGNVGAICAATPGSWLTIVLNALLCAAIPYVLYTLGLSHMENSTASIIATFEPVMATIIGIFVFGEVPTLIHIVGMVLVLVAVVLLRPQKMQDVGVPESVATDKK